MITINLNRRRRSPAEIARRRRYLERRREKRRQLKGTVWTSCRGKQAFVLPEGAEARRLQILEHEYCRNPHLLEAYCCRFCFHWHVGHRPHDGSLNVSFSDSQFPANTEVTL
jgi:hypothetical protein